MDNRDNENTNRIFENLKSDTIDEEKMEVALQKANFLGNLLDDFVTMVSMVKDYFSGNFSIPKGDLILLIGAISYVALPIDGVPDFIPALGFADDIAIVGFVLKKISDLLKKYKEENGKY